MSESYRDSIFERFLDYRCVSAQENSHFSTLQLESIKKIIGSIGRFN